MAPLLFYEIPFEKWLFKDHSFVRRTEPEEKVRQWALFELLSTYRISIKNIEIEQKVKVGSKTYRADIVVFRRGNPYILIECKRRDFTQITKGMEQAISYTTSLDTEFVVFTNGKKWQVKRRIEGKWASVPDIPTQADELDEKEFVDLVDLIEALKRPLYWLHQAIPAESTQKFLASVQRLFSGHTNFFNGIDTKLIDGTECMLSALSYKPFFDDKYTDKKLHAASILYQEYFKRRGFEWKLTHPTLFEIDDKIRQLHYEFFKLEDGLRGLQHGEAWLIKFNIELLKYFGNIRSAGKYLGISEGLVTTFQRLIEPFCQSILGVQLSNKTNDPSLYQLYCREAWQNYNP